MSLLNPNKEQAEAWTYMQLKNYKKDVEWFVSKFDISPDDIQTFSKWNGEAKKAKKLEGWKEIEGETLDKREWRQKIWLAEKLDK